MSHAHAIVNFNEFLQLTQQEFALMQDFAQVLVQEEAALIDNSADRLIGITEEKNGLLTQILALEKNRNTCLASSGYTADREGMRSLLSATNAPTELGIAWRELLEISSRAQENNRVNGILIHRQLNRNQSTLNLLNNNSQAGAIYGADGQSKNMPNAGRGIIAG